MSVHVHVRIRDVITLSDEGELTEHFSCQCGHTWTTARALGVDDDPQRE